ncbi:MAG: RidA family protein [Pseudomonadota bacterium]
MHRRSVNPRTLYDAGQYGFVHATRSQGGTYLHCSGQVAFNKDSQTVGANDLAAQAAQAFDNLRAVLADQGAGPENVVSLRTYVTNYDVSKLDIVSGAIADFFGDAEPSAQTLLGVQALALPDLLIEVEAVAALDD